MLTEDGKGRMDNESEREIEEKRGIEREWETNKRTRGREKRVWKIAIN